MTNIEVVREAIFTGHRDCIYALAPGTENTFFSAGADGMVVAWDIHNPEKGKLVVKTSNSVYSLYCLKDFLIVGDNFQGIRMIELLQNKEVRSAAITDSAIFDIKVLQNYILVAAGDGNLIVSDLRDLSTIIKIKKSDLSARCIAIHPDLKEFAVGYSDNYIRIFSSESFKLIYEFKAHNNSVFSLEYTPDGVFLLSGSRDAHLNIWTVSKQYKMEQSIVAHMFAINSITISEDGKYFATCSMDKSIKIWDCTNFRLLKVIDKARHAGHGTSVNKLLWVQNGCLISASDDRTISMWNIKYL